MNSKGRNHVCSIKPLGTPVSNKINKIIIKKENFLPLTELDAITTQRRSIVTPRMRLQMKKEVKQRDWRNDAKKASQRWTNTDRWRTAFGVKWFREISK
jgi:hypothetical protein